MKSVGYSVDDYGYSVNVYDDDAGTPVESYRAGNHRMESTIEVERGDPCRLPKSTLRKFAKQTAGEMAAEHGTDVIFEEEEA